MKLYKKIFATLAFFSSSNQLLEAYAISHNKDSALPEVTIFVFTSQEEFKKMLKAQGVSQKSLNIIGKVAPYIGKGSGALAEMAGFGEIKPALVAGGKALGRTAKYASGPAKWLLEQKYSVALHKNVKRGNKGKGAAWNWKDIKRDKGIDPADPKGLFVVFLYPKNNQILLTTFMGTKAGLGFTTHMEDGELISEKAPFERDIIDINKDEALQNPSYLATAYYYLQRGYQKPHKVVDDIKKSFTSFKEKTKSGKDILGYLKNKLSSTKASFAQMSAPEMQDVINFFMTEIEGVRAVAQDEEARQTVSAMINDVKHLNNMYNDVIVKTGKEYTQEQKKFQEKQQERIRQAEEDLGTGTGAPKAIAQEALEISPEKKKQTFTPEQERELKNLKRKHALTQKVREGFNAGRSIEKGLQQAALNRMEDQINQAHTVVQDAINSGNAPGIYRTYISKLNQAVSFLETIIPQLHQEYSAGFETQDAGTLARIKNQLRSPEFERYKQEVLAIYGSLVEKINAETQESSSWIQSLPRLAKSTLSSLSKNILQSYAKEIGDTIVSTEQLQTLLNKNKAQGVTQARTLLDEMQKYIYKQENQKFFSSKTSLKQAKQIASHLRSLYPDLLTMKDAQQIDNSLDVPTSILLTQAQGIAMVMNNLSSELLELENRLRQ